MSRKSPLINSFVFTALAGLFAALTVLLFTSRPIFSLGSEGPTLSSRKNAGLAIYHKAWDNTQSNFVFTDRLKDWSKWEHKFDDKIKTKADGIKYAAEMLKSLNDKYTRILDESQTESEKDSLAGKFVGIGVQFFGRTGANGEAVIKDGDVLPLADAEQHPIIHRVFKTTPASGAGLKDRDIILSVNNKSTAGMTVTQIAENIRGPAGTTVSLEIKRGQKRFNVRVPRRKFDVEAVSYHTLPNNLGYIRIDSFISENTADQCLSALKALKNCRGYILDLRSNPGGRVEMAQDVAALFQDRGVVFGVRQRQGDGILKGSAMTGDTMPHIAAKKPLVILVNNGTASAAEIVAGALHDNRNAKLVGCQTYGKGLMQGVFQITGGIYLHVTIAQWLTPKGVCPGSDPKTENPNGLPVDVNCKNGPYIEMDTDTDNQLKAAIQAMPE